MRIDWHTAVAKFRSIHGAIDWNMLPVGRYHQCSFCFTGLTLPVSDLDLEYGTLYGIYNAIRMVSYLETIPDLDR
jgi:hypothetical protein